MAGEADRNRALREAADVAVGRRDVASLFQDVARPLQRMIRFDFLNHFFHYSGRNMLQVNMIANGGACGPSEAADEPIGDSYAGWVWQTRQPIGLNGVAGETRFQRRTSILIKHGIGPYCIVPLTTAQRRLGALGFGSNKAPLPKLISNSCGRLHARLRWF
jgi:formate hydrogenlyase transcriptional activator